MGSRIHALRHRSNSRPRNPTKSHPTLRILHLKEIEKISVESCHGWTRFKRCRLPSLVSLQSIPLLARSQRRPSYPLHLLMFLSSQAINHQDQDLMDAPEFAGSQGHLSARSQVQSHAQSFLMTDISRRLLTLCVSSLFQYIRLSYTHTCTIPLYKQT